jgi:hypothetical protein
MKKIIYILVSTIMLGSFYSCTDGFESKNTDPNKIYTINAQYIFPGTMLKTMNWIGELNFNVLMNQSRYLTVQAFQGPTQDESSTNYKHCYVEIIRDLTSIEEDYTDKPGYENRLGMVKTWKAYVYYMMVSLYGGIPMSDALLTSETKTTYKYDAEEEVYRQILKLLNASTVLFNPQTQYSSDFLQMDPVFGGKSDVNKWRKFANTMMLNVAMNVQNLNNDLAKEYATLAMAHEDWMISSVAEIVQPTWGTNTTYDVSYYYTRLLKGVEQNGIQQTTYPGMGEYLATYLFSFNDPRIGAFFETSNSMGTAVDKPFLTKDTLSRPHICTKAACLDYVIHKNGADAAKYRDSIIVSYTVPYVPLTDLVVMATSWEADYIPGSTTLRYSDPLTYASKFNPSYLKKDFLKKDAKLVFLNWSDACFLKAEAKILFGLGVNDAQTYYNQGVSASFAQYGLTGTATYLAHAGVTWNTSFVGYPDRRNLYHAQIMGKGGDDAHLEQIYKQRYIADFMNCLEGWNLERRTRVMNFPPLFATGQSSAYGSNSTYNYFERYMYPLNELSLNNSEYFIAINNLSKVSPLFNTANSGNNCYTSLGFSKKIPNIETADARYIGNKKIIFNYQYFQNFYGITYEDLVLNAVKQTGEINETNALLKAYQLDTKTIVKLKHYLIN